MTHLKSILLACAVTTSAAVLPFESKASDWGCEVLLCLSGDWKGTPSCHPPVYKLIAAMKKPGFNWPTCPQANSTKAKYEPYKQCPAGFASIGGDDSLQGNGLSRGAKVCQAEVNARGKPVKDLGNGQNQTSVSYKAGPLTLEDGTVVNVTKTQPQLYDSGSSKWNFVYSFPRPRNEKPYFIEYDDAENVRQRAWFTLN